MSTVKSVAATRSMRSRSVWIAWLEPMRGAVGRWLDAEEIPRLRALDFQQERRDVYADFQ